MSHNTQPGIRACPKQLKNSGRKPHFTVVPLRKVLSLSFFLAVCFSYLTSELPSLAQPTQDCRVVVLVNSTSPGYLDFPQYIQPYFEHFGFPYSTLDISTNNDLSTLSNYAAIVIGHPQLDTNRFYLNPPSQQLLADAVSNGVGLISFDGVLFDTNQAALYEFSQNIFGFAPGAAATGTNLMLVPTATGMHYITERHATNQVVRLRVPMVLNSLLPGLNDTPIVLSSGRPFVIVKSFGKGRAVQFANDNWMAVSVLGPLQGVDDLVWRSIAWAARKPFVMRGMPALLTFRVDDAEGPFDWAHVAIEYGLKPWVGPFINEMKETNIVDLRAMVTNGNATASIHALTGSTLLYWDHAHLKDYSATTLSNNFRTASSWHTNHQLPIAKVVIPHYSEMQLDAIPYLTNWHVEFTTLKNDVSTARDSPWLVGGPFRLYEQRRLGSTNYPLFYADFLRFPTNPAIDMKIFNVVTEIRDDATCMEWCPDNDVAGTIGRGTRQLTRAFDAQAMGTLFTHEWYIHPTSTVGGHPTITTTNWRAILGGILSNCAPYHPRLVTMDEGCQYVRATRTAKLVGAQYDPVTGAVHGTFTGTADMDLTVTVFTDTGESVREQSGFVRAFTNGTETVMAQLGTIFKGLHFHDDHTVQLTFTGPTNLNYQIEASSNLLDWVTLTNLSNGLGVLDFIDYEASNNASRFYRAWHVP